MEIVHVVAINPYRKGNKGKVFSYNIDTYDKVIESAAVKKMIQQIRGELPIDGVDLNDAQAVKKAQERLKSELPFFCPHYGMFKNNVRRQENALPESFLFQTIIDVDDKEYVEKAIEKARELNCSSGIWNGSLLHLCYSARKKLHIGIRMPIGMTIEETQKAYCEALGVPYDESCITPERMIFLTDKDSEIYRSKMWCAVLPESEIQARRQAFLNRGLTVDGKKNLPQISQMTQIHSGEIHDTGKSVKSVSSVGQNINHKFQNKDDVQNNRLSGNRGDYAAPAGTAVQSAQSGNSNYVDDSHFGNPGGNYGTDELGEASEKNLIAFDLFVQSAGLEGMAIDTVGSRHSSLLAIMSAGASRVMSEEELMKVVRTKMPSYYQEDDCHQLIHDFYAKYADSCKPMSRDVIRVNALAEKQASQQVNSLQLTVNSLNANHAVQSSYLQVQSSEEDYPEPPAMPEKLPKLVELLISRTPEVYKPAVAHAIFPPLATHLWQTSFRYIDNVVHEATLSTCLLAGTGAGKSSVDKPIRYIMEDIRKRDAENLKREKEWKEEVTRKGANKDKRKRPDNLVIQEIDADMTSPAFVMRTAEAQGRFLYTSLNELDQFDALRGSGNQQFRIMCLAFDPFNLFGQQRVGVQSVTERVTIRFNWNASTTIQKGQRYFSKVLTDGPISRINFCTIPEREIGDEMPVYGDYNDAYREALKPYIENLNNARGLIDCPEAFQLALKLKDENAEFSRLSQDRVYENLSFRANVIAYLKACVLYVANGCKWEPEIDEFIRWSERYDLYCKMRFFGDAIKRANDTGEKSSKRGPSNMLMQLPDEFTYQQVIDLRVANGMSQKGTSKMLGNWKDRHYIRAKENDSVPQFLSSSVFIKLKFRKENS
ncbi:hypothetical protein [Segatella copri]|uniref:Uncharacterized protein n=1 Tax=Segatella copri TaxID=165179 RepID=A0AAW9TBN5_9BACT|nr:hypothetical protein [Segatella copri]MQN28345.1 hypothetical protein [Segatella copri]MQN30431.1 hypothetical protein [Segatella copri]MQN37897.1 hypothetical protein [Segatella copri]MQN75021.1 hypothetical protein [Segatella copri]MQO27970.1 hypothetical protein [Segatella copri]